MTLPGGGMVHILCSCYVVVCILFLCVFVCFNVCVLHMYVVCVECQGGHSALNLSSVKACLSTPCPPPPPPLEFRLYVPFVHNKVLYQRS